MQRLDDFEAALGSDCRLSSAFLFRGINRPISFMILQFSSIILWPLDSFHCEKLVLCLQSCDYFLERLQLSRDAQDVQQTVCLFYSAFVLLQRLLVETCSAAAALVRRNFWLRSSRLLGLLKAVHFLHEELADDSPVVEGVWKVEYEKEHVDEPAELAESFDDAFVLPRDDHLSLGVDGVLDEVRDAAALFDLFRRAG